jgi:hypothetical protein
MRRALLVGVISALVGLLHAPAAAAPTVTAVACARQYDCTWFHQGELPVLFEIDYQDPFAGPPDCMITIEGRPVQGCGSANSQPVTGDSKRWIVTPDLTNYEQGHVTVVAQGRRRRPRCRGRPGGGPIPGPRSPRPRRAAWPP